MNTTVRDCPMYCCSYEGVMDIGSCRREAVPYEAQSRLPRSPAEIRRLFQLLLVAIRGWMFCAGSRGSLFPQQDSTVIIRTRTE